jgi:hypothetical protein
MNFRCKSDIILILCLISSSLCFIRAQKIPLFRIPSSEDHEIEYVSTRIRSGFYVHAYPKSSAKPYNMSISLSYSNAIAAGPSCSNFVPFECLGDCNVSTNAIPELIEDPFLAVSGLPMQQNLIVGSSWQIYNATVVYAINCSSSSILFSELEKNPINGVIGLAVSGSGHRNFLNKINRFLLSISSPSVAAIDSNIFRLSQDSSPLSY